MNIYNISRAWFDYCFENPEKIKPNHTAILFFAIEHCNRLGWKEKFGFPTTMAMEALGIKSYNTYMKAFNELVDWGFIKLIEKSKNQYSANIIALLNFNKANNEALDKAFMKHSAKQSESTVQSKVTISKQVYNNTNEQVYIEPTPSSNSFDPTKTIKPDADAKFEFYKSYSAIKPFNVNDADFTSAYFEAVHYADGEDVVNTSANSYVQYCQVLEIPQKYVKNPVKWLTEGFYRTDWQSEAKKELKEKGEKGDMKMFDKYMLLDMGEQLCNLIK